MPKTILASIAVLFVAFNCVLGESVYPDPPTGLKAHLEADGSILLSWKASKASFVAGYNAYYHLAGKNGYFRINSKSIQETKLKVPPLPPGKYRFFVRAFQTSYQPPTESPNSKVVGVKVGKVSGMSKNF